MQVPGFRIERTIGRGGMATVYLAIQESLDREVVLKIMSFSHADGADFLGRFLNEGRIVASLRHPHIVTIFDIGTTEDMAYISMEYVDGGDLKARIAAGGDPADALDVLVRIGGALEFAHDQGVVHRDIKPANILYRSDGTALLSDFGIAKQVAVDSELTSTGTILGSPFYMSPEQAEGVVVDGRTDLYSLGIIFYEMLTGERPYQGDSALKVIMQHVRSPPPTLPKELIDYQPLLARLVAKNRDERLPDAATLVAEAEALREAIRTGTTGEQLALASVGAGRTPPDEVEHGVARFLHDRTLQALLAVIVALVAGFAAFYAYTQSLGPSVVAARRGAPQAEVTAQLTPPTAAAVAASAGAAAGQGVGKQDVAKALSWLAKNSVRENRLTQPPADNAYYYYSRLLALEPTNQAARTGFTEIAERFALLAEEEFSRKDYGKAQSYIALGLQVEPDNQALISLQSFLVNRKQSLLETVLGFFK